MKSRTEKARDLIALLDEHQDEIASAWLEAIRGQMPESKYGQRPPEEISANNLVALAMIRDLLRGTAADAVWQRHAVFEVSAEYVGLGIDASEFVMAALLLEEVVRPLVEESFPPSTTGSRRVHLQLDHHVHLLAQAIVRGYVEVASQHLHAQQERTALMLEMARAAGGSLDLEQVLGRVAQGIAAAVEAQHCLILLVSDDSQSFRIWAATDQLPSAMAEHLRRTMAQPCPVSDLRLARLVVESKQPLACYDVQSDSRTDHELMAALGIRSMLQVPFVVRDRVQAVAMVPTFDESRSFAREQIELAIGIADTVAPAIENARLYRRVEGLAALEERMRLAREIHDDIAQMLGVLQLRASLLDDLLSDEKVAQARASLPQLQEMIDETYTAVRELVFNLRAMALPPAGFLPSLQEYLADYQLHSNLEVSLEADVDAVALLGGNTSVQVLRIIQEALTNARRHARANHARLRIEWLGEWVCVSVEDDGQGFDSSAAFSAGHSHFGLQVMRERAQIIRGDLVVDSHPGEGTRIELRLPGLPRGGQP